MSETGIGDAAGTGLRVFLIDDNEMNLVVAKARLGVMGHSVAVAMDGQQAVDGYEAGKHDIVLMDIQMPVLDGFEATRRIRKRDDGTDVPIIGVSAGGPGVSKAKALEAGMNDFVAKPVDWNHLNDLMRNFCSSGQNGQSD